MILFNEGLPRSGKSHDAVKSHIIPAVKAGRYVVAYIEGLDPEQCGVVAGVGPEVGRELVKVLTREEAAEIWKHCGKDSLVVVDEAQNFWPTGRQPLKPELTAFVAEHGHDGLDLLLMGQCLADVHPVWRRRVSQKTVFTKMEAVGASSRYTWVTYKASSPEKFKETTKSAMLGEPYDPAIFGCYKSHNDGTENKDTYVDPRANLLRSPLFRYGLPLALVGLVAGGWFVYRSIWGGGLVESTTKRPVGVEQVAAVPGQPVGYAGPVGARMGQSGHPPHQPPKDWADRLFERLEGARVVYTRTQADWAPVVKRLSDDNPHKTAASIWIEAKGPGVNHVFTLEALERAGFKVEFGADSNPRYVVVSYKDKTALISEGLRDVSSGGVFK